MDHAPTTMTILAECCIAGAITLLFVATLPILATIAFAMRPVLILGAAIGLLAMPVVALARASRNNGTTTRGRTRSS